MARFEAAGLGHVVAADLVANARRWVSFVTPRVSRSGSSLPRAGRWSRPSPPPRMGEPVAHVPGLGQDVEDELECQALGATGTDGLPGHRTRMNSQAIMNIRPRSSEAESHPCIGFGLLLLIFRAPPVYPGDNPCPTKGAAIQSHNDEDQSTLQRGTLGIRQERYGEAELH